MFVINTPAGVMTNTFSDENVDVTLDVVAEINVEVLTDVNTNVSVAAMIDLAFVMSVP